MPRNDKDPKKYSKHLEYNKYWKQKDRKIHPEKYKKYYQTHKEQIKKRSLKFKYGIDKSDLNSMLKLQNNKCAICGEVFVGKEPFIDHNHKTGKIRGLLCLNCNTMLGHSFDRILTLRKAIEYLQKEEE